MGNTDKIFNMWKENRIAYREADIKARKTGSPSNIREAVYAKGKTEAINEIGAAYYGCTALQFTDAMNLVVGANPGAIEDRIRRMGKSTITDTASRIAADWGRAKLLNQ